MGLLDRLFSNKKRSREYKTDPGPADKPVCNSRPLTYDWGIPADSAFDPAAFHRSANADYPKQSLKMMAIAAEKVAEIINENFDTRNIRCMVPAVRIAGSAAPGALPVHFLFQKEGAPKVAVVIVTKNGYYVNNVLATKAICDRQGIAYVRVFADGPYAEWITDKSISHETVEACRSSIAERIRKGHVNSFN